MNDIFIYRGNLHKIYLSKFIYQIFYLTRPLSLWFVFRDRCHEFLKWILKYISYFSCHILLIRNKYEMSLTVHSVAALHGGKRGDCPPCFFLFAPFLKTLPRLKLPLMAFTHYLLWGLKNLPPLNFKLSPPLRIHMYPRIDTNMII